MIILAASTYVTMKGAVVFALICSILAFAAGLLCGTSSMPGPEDDN